MFQKKNEEGAGREEVRVGRVERGARRQKSSAQLASQVAAERPALRRQHSGQLRSRLSVRCPRKMAGNTEELYRERNSIDGEKEPRQRPWMIDAPIPRIRARSDSSRCGCSATSAPSPAAEIEKLCSRKGI